MPDHYDNYSILPHAREARVLLLHTATGWTLPRHSATTPIEINAAMQEQLGLTTTVLYCAYDRYQDDERDDQHLVYALENHSPEAPLPANGRWIDRAELAHLDLAVPEHRPVLETWFDDVIPSPTVIPPSTPTPSLLSGQALSHSAIPNHAVILSESEGSHPQRLPWMCLGWLAEVTSWIDAQLTRLGHSQTAPIEQVTAQPWSAVLRVPTTAGTLYFKVPAPVFAFELPLTETLAHLIPGSVPHLLATDTERHWMLMHDAGKTLRSGPLDPARLEAALQRFAQLQLQLAPHLVTLKATGCPDWRLSQLPQLYQQLLAATPFLLLDEPKGLPRGEYTQLLAYTPQLSDICAELASYNIPETLGHVDLHTNNIVYNNGRYIFIDLAECILSHPFCAMFIALRSAKYRLGYDDAALHRLTQTYLAPWTQYAPMDRLQQAFALAQRLAILHKALSWYSVISHLEPSMHWMFQDNALYYLRVFLGTQE